MLQECFYGTTTPRLINLPKLPPSCPSKRSQAVIQWILHHSTYTTLSDLAPFSNSSVHNSAYLHKTQLPFVIWFNIDQWSFRIKLKLHHYLRSSTVCYRTQKFYFLLHFQQDKWFTPSPIQVPSSTTLESDLWFHRLQQSTHDKLPQLVSLETFTSIVDWFVILIQYVIF